MKNIFVGPLIFSILVLAALFFWGGFAAFLLAAILAVLEVTLSFDNAIINAKVLQDMSPQWQKRFLTWGMLISVVGVRLLLPILIVSVVVGASPILMTTLAFTDAAQYASLVEHAKPAIEAFGGVFLLLVALQFFFDEGKEVHWIRGLERRLSQWGRVEAIGIALTLGLLLTIIRFSSDEPLLILTSGMVGAILFVLVEGITALFGIEAGSAAKSGAALFVYLNVLDSAFSLDGVVGAFALTTAIPIIVAGLGIGAYFVRSLTVMLVRGGVLKKYLYLEHGAHWAIFALALCMLQSLISPVPEWFIAGIGLVVVIFSFFSSQRAARA